MTFDDEHGLRLGAQAPTGRQRDPAPADDLDDGAACAEDSGADSFLDRFTPPRDPDAPLRW
ncbi:hypothetical protein ACFQ4O_15250 [Methylopila musalis]|uniref:Uncharacterized protein n=1 Tax=Methylopila musalis TaxID=1134781 RepID=A0ABW3ZBC4_9HYPH